MRRTFLSPSLSRAALALVCGLLLSGCLNGGAKYASGPEYTPEEHDYLRADTRGAYAECVAVCSQDTSLALVTRAGCLDACERAADFFPIAGKAYSSRNECPDGLLRAELERDGQVAAMRRWCDDKWSHVHNRKGCRTAADAFFAALTPASVCGGDSDESEAYLASLANARERAAYAPVPETPSAPGAATTPDAAPETQAAPAEPHVAPLPPAAPAQPEAAPTAAGDAAPAGAIVPPPYAPGREPVPSVPQAAGPAPVQTGGPAPATALPTIHDTPKYQKPSAPTTRATQPKRESSPTVPSQTARPAPAQKTATPKVQAGSGTEPSAPDTVRGAQATPEKLAGSAETAIPAQPAPGSVPAAAPSGMPPLPAAPASDPHRDAAAATMLSPTPGAAAPRETDSPPAPRTRTDVPAPAAPGGTGKPQETPNSGATPAARIPLDSPLPQEAAPLPPVSQSPATPGAAQPPATPQAQQPPAAKASPRPRVYLPPIPEKPAEPAPESPPSAMMPPPPSMLHQPYNAPVLISPQIEAPPGEPGR